MITRGKCKENVRACIFYDIICPRLKLYPDHTVLLFCTSLGRPFLGPEILPFEKFSVDCGYRKSQCTCIKVNHHKLSINGPCSIAMLNNQRVHFDGFRKHMAASSQ